MPSACLPGPPTAQTCLSGRRSAGSCGQGPPASVGDAQFGQASSGVDGMRVLQGTVASIVVCLALAGCQDSDGKEPTAGGSDRARPRRREQTPTEAPAASGPAIKGDIFTVNAPEGWTKDKDFSTDFLDQYSDAGRGRTAGRRRDRGRGPSSGRGRQGQLLAVLPDGTKRKRVADATVAGHPATTSPRMPASATSTRRTAWSRTAAGDHRFTLTGTEAGASGGHRLGPGQLGVDVARGLRSRRAGRTAPAPARRACSPLSVNS